MTRFLIAAAAALAFAPLSQAQGTQKASDARAEFFAAGKVAKLAIEIDPKGMDSLRKDPRQYVKATLTETKEDGTKVVYADVGVHLRGSVGSFRNVDEKPGLTLNMDKFTDGQRFHGMEKLHLANSNQDPTYLQELICGELCRAAGVPAAKIGHATVTLNGRKLGFFYLKEGYDKGFLKAHFPSLNGNFYDGGFLRDIDQDLELISGKGDVPNREDLKALLAAAREGDPKKRFEKLEKLLDLDKFVSLIVLEVIFWDWDGYPLKPNNYRVYHDPKSNKITIIPSGMDQMWSDPNGPLFPGFGGVVARGLMETPKGKELYLARMAEVLKTVYKPDDLLKRLDELQARVQPALLKVDEGAGKDYPNQVRRLREAIPQRAKSLTEQLKQQTKK